MEILMAMLAALRELIITIAILLGAIVGIVGIDSWRREFVWRHHYTLAEQAIVYFRKVSGAISTIRSPIGFTGEGSTRKRGENESPEEQRSYDQAYVLFERYNKFSDLWSEFYAHRIKFEVAFGKEAAEPFSAVNKETNKMIVAAHALGREWARHSIYGYVEDDPERHRAAIDRLTKYEEHFWEGRNIEGEDEIKANIEAACEQMESFCRPKLRVPTLWESVKLAFRGSSDNAAT